MTFRIKVLGFVIAAVELEFPATAGDARLTPIDKGVKGMSSWWMGRMNR